MKRVLSCLGMFVIALAAAGCGGGGVEVTGTVTKDGKQVSFAEGENVNITLQGDTVTGSATVNKDGTFVAKQPDGKPLPAGKYKVSVTYYKPVDPKAKGPPERPESKNIGETWDVSSSNKTFTLDLSKYAGGPPAKK